MKNKNNLMLFGAIIITLLMISSATAVSINHINNNKNLTDILSAGSPPNIEWEKIYTNSYSESGIALDKTSDNGYILAGIRKEDIHNFSVVLIKTDQNGTKEWNKTFFKGKINLKIVQQTDDDGYILFTVGVLESNKIQSKLTKLFSNGTVEWIKNFEGDSDYDSISEAWQTSDGGFILVGGKINGLIDSDVWVIKTNSQGNIEWEKTFDNSDLLHKYSDAGMSVCELSNGGYIIGGTTAKVIGINTYLNVWLIKIDSNGNKIIDKTYGESFSRAMWGVNSIRETNDGGFIAVGCRNTKSDKEKTFFWAIKTDSNLNQEKVFEINPDKEKYESFNSVRTTYEGGFILIGQGYTMEPGYVSCYSKLLKLNKNLYNEWYVDYEYDDGLVYNGVEQTTDNGFVVVGANKENVSLLKIAKENLPPNKPEKPVGAVLVNVNGIYHYKTKTTDPEGDQVYYKFDLGDGRHWFKGEYDSGEEINVALYWTLPGSFKLKVRALDVKGHYGEWSDPLSVTVPKQKATNRLFQYLQERYPVIFSLINQILRI